MREFVVVGHEAPTEGDFSLDDLPGAGRVDVLCRCVADAFLTSHGLREDVRVFLVLQDAITIRFEGAELRYLTPDERNVASLIRTALEAQDEAIGAMEAEGTPGVYVSTRGLSGVLEERSDPVYLLHQDGDPITDVGPGGDPTFLLSDHESFSETELSRLDAVSTKRVSVSPEALHADQAITVAHAYLDTDGFTRF